MNLQFLARGLFAGLATGIVAVLLQFAFVTPLLLEGELYESGLRVHFATSLDAPVQSPAGPAASLTQEMSRHVITAGFNFVTYSAFGLILAAGMALSQRAGHQLTVRTGMIWGMAGFATLHLAPAFGLPPELPGTIGAEIEARQIWWITAVFSTGVGLACIGFGRGLLWLVLGVVLVAAPQVIGAPHLDTYFGIAPPELSALFATRSLGVAAVTWVILGALTAYLLTRIDIEED